MPERNTFDYAILRLVPRVEREEFVNAGVIVFCLGSNFLQARVLQDSARWLALWPELDEPLVRTHLEAFVKVCDGVEDGGPIARLPKRERFHWLVAPRSTMIQVSPVHSGLCAAPAEALNEIFDRLVAR